MLCMVRKCKNCRQQKGIFEMGIKTNSQKLFDNVLITILKSRVTLTLNKPAYVGMCILDLSKVLMYEFHYDYIKNEYGNN